MTTNRTDCDYHAKCEVTECGWEGPPRSTASNARQDEIRHLMTHRQLDTPITVSRFGRLTHPAPDSRRA